MLPRSPSLSPSLVPPSLSLSLLAFFHLQPFIRPVFPFYSVCPAEHIGLPLLLLSDLMLPHCLAPVFTCLASLGHGCVCLRSKKTIVGTGGLWYLQPANRDHDLPPTHATGCACFFFFPLWQANEQTESFLALLYWVD